MKRSLLLILITALLALGLVAGCGGDDDDGSGGGDTTAQNETTTDTGTTETETEAEAGGSKEEYDKAFGEINDELLEVGNDVGQTINTAKGKTDAALATAFTDLTERTRGVKEKLDGLQPPPEYEKLHNDLSAAIEVVAGDLEAIATAAENNDAGDARTEAQELVRHSVAVRTARRALARETGAKVEGGGN
jgi:ABC-type glycerol-3-phosphate transport system substrate-binding protein